MLLRIQKINIETKEKAMKHKTPKEKRIQRNERWTPSVGTLLQKRENPIPVT